MTLKVKLLKNMMRTKAYGSALIIVLMFSFGLCHVSAETMLPAQSTFGDIEPSVAMRDFRSVRLTGSRSQDSLLGELIFESPRLLGGMARNTGISCDTCHIRGDRNPDFFIPGGSDHPGSFNGAAFLFNPSSGQISQTAIIIPSLFGISERSRFGHDGRTDTLRNFIHDVIVKEFSGTEPSHHTLDLVTAYVADLEKRPNSRLAATGILKDPTTPEAEGQILFFKPFPESNKSCATCHMPERQFSDDVLHVLDKRTLRTASLTDRNDAVRYFHDGRSPNLRDAINQKNSEYKIGLSESEIDALIAYLKIVETVDQPQQPATADLALSEIADARLGLQYAVASGDMETLAIAADGFSRKLQLLAAEFDAFSNEADSSPARRAAIAAIADATIAIFKLRTYAEEDQLDEITAAYAAVQVKLDEMAQPVRNGAQSSLFSFERLKAYREKIGRPLRRP